MSRCIRDKNGRFARHEFDVPPWSEEKEHQTCVRCGLKILILNLVRLLHKRPPVLETTVIDVLGEENELLHDVPFKRAM